jgi:predicted TIM-barrel fold metal-dependent hydrolase
VLPVAAEPQKKITQNTWRPEMNPNHEAGHDFHRGITRREFMAAATATAAAPFLAGARAGEPMLDTHQHTHYHDRTTEQLVAHQVYHGVTMTVLQPGDGWMLGQIGDNADCARLQVLYPDQFVRFANCDVAESRTVDVLRGNIQRGALGFGELKYKVAVDSPEMHRVYKLADELGVPIMMHFEFEMYNTGFERFESILKTYPKVVFFGHAQTFWANISADADQTVLYPTGPVKPGGLTDRLLSDYANLYADMSAGSGLNAITRDPEFYRGFIERHSRKLIWASDCDCRDGRGAGVKAGYCIAGRCLAALRKLVPDQATFRRITYDNGAAVLKLKPAVA